MEYKISNIPPPVFDSARELWGVSFDNTVFTYGDTIHTKNPMSEDLLVHELVHVGQQTKMGKDEWWAKYFEDAEFRLSQEIEAYKAQYKWVTENINDRNVRIKYLIFYSQSLSGSMYGGIISEREARKQIQNVR